MPVTDSQYRDLQSQIDRYATRLAQDLGCNLKALADCIHAGYALGDSEHEHWWSDITRHYMDLYSIDFQVCDAIMSALEGKVLDLRKRAEGANCESD